MGTAETTIHYLFHFLNFSVERITLFNKLRSTDEMFLSENDYENSKVLLFCEHSFNDVKNTSDLNATVECIISTKRFDTPLNEKLTRLYLSMFYGS